VEIVPNRTLWVSRLDIGWCSGILAVATTVLMLNTTLPPKTYNGSLILDFDSEAFGAPLKPILGSFPGQKILYSNDHSIPNKGCALSLHRKRKVRQGRGLGTEWNLRGLSIMALLYFSLDGTGDSEFLGKFAERIRSGEKWPSHWLIPGSPMIMGSIMLSTYGNLPSDWFRREKFKLRKWEKEFYKLATQVSGGRCKPYQMDDDTRRGFIYSFNGPTFQLFLSDTENCALVAL